MMIKGNEQLVYSLLLLFDQLIHWFLVARHKCCQWCIDLPRNINVNICSQHTIHSQEQPSPTWFCPLLCRSHGTDEWCRGCSRVRSCFPFLDWNGRYPLCHVAALLRPVPLPRRVVWQDIWNCAPGLLCNGSFNRFGWIVFLPERVMQLNGESVEANYSIRDGKGRNGKTTGGYKGKYIITLL